MYSLHNDRPLVVLVYINNHRVSFGASEAIIQNCASRVRNTNAPHSSFNCDRISVELSDIHT